MWQSNVMGTPKGKVDGWEVLFGGGGDRPQETEGEGVRCDGTVRRSTKGRSVKGGITEGGSKIRVPVEDREDVRDRHGNGMVYLPEHKRRRGNGYVPKKILVVEGMIGRELRAEERVVVLNGDMDDFSPGNLRVKVVGSAKLWRVEELR